MRTLKPLFKIIRSKHKKNYIKNYESLLMACKYAVAMMDSIAPYPVEKLQKDLIKLEQVLVARTRHQN